MSLIPQDRVAIIVLIIITSLLIGTTIMSVIFFERFENVSVFEEISIASANLSKKNIELSEQIQELRKEQEDLTKKAIPRFKQEELESLEKQIGIREVKGEGVSILLDDHPDMLVSFSDNIMCHGANIRDIINVLKLPELEVQAISINGIRIQPQTSINCFSDGISVNTTKLFAAYQIDVVGNTKKIVNSLKTPTLLPQVWEQVDQNTIILEVEEKKNITIPPSQTTPKGNFIKKTEQEEEKIVDSF